LLIRTFMIVAVFSTGIRRLSITVTTIACTNEVFTTLTSAIQLSLSFLSAIFYDVSLFPALVQPIVQTNPMTWAMQAFRALKSQESTLYPISVLVGPSLACALLGAVCYLWYTRL